METSTLSPKMLRQRKFLLALPVLLIPFITLLFWSLGGGKGNEAKAETPKGFNSKLPEAVLAGSGDLNKLSYYNQARLDSQKRLEERRSDPYAQQAIDSVNRPGSIRLNNGPDPAANEAKIYQQLATLQAAVNKPAPQPVQVAQPERVTHVQKASEDPELKQMNGLLEKVLEIQHPERVKEKAEIAAPKSIFSAIPAIVEGNQKVTEGTVVRIKLTDTVTINGQLIPKGQLIFGSCSLYNQRLILTIKNIRLGYAILPVDLTVFDMNDGLEGISVPEAITGDAIKSGADNGLQSMQLMSLDESVGAQAAAASINAAKGLFSKKIKRVKGKIKDGHPLLLRDNKKIKN